MLFAFEVYFVNCVTIIATASWATIRQSLSDIWSQQMLLTMSSTFQSFFKSLTIYDRFVLSLIFFDRSSNALFNFSLIIILILRWWMMNSSQTKKLEILIKTSIGSVITNEIWVITGRRWSINVMQKLRIQFFSRHFLLLFDFPPLDHRIKSIELL